MAKTHPHIESPTDAQLREVVEDRPETIVETYLAFHRVVLGALPNVVFSVDTVDCAIGYGARQYGYGGWGMAALTPHAKWVSLTIMQGAKLDVESDLLVGTSSMRHVKLSSAEDVEAHSTAIAEIIVAASKLHA